MLAFDLPRSTWGSAQAPGYNHGDALPIPLVGVSVKTDQVPLLELNCQENIGGCGYGKNQMGHSHRRRGPEGKEPAEIERMAHVSLGPRRLKLHRRTLSACQIEVDLSQPEEIKVVDQKGGRQNNEPAQSKERPEKEATRGVLHVPNDPAHGPPLPEEEQQQEARNQDIGARSAGSGTILVHARLNH